MNERTYHFIKLGGSLITDKNRPLTPRPLVIQRLAEEIACAHRARPERCFLLSHGSGSYGHVAGKKYKTRDGVYDVDGWQGFVETGYIAAQLNRLVLAAFLRAQLPVISLSPASLVRCSNGNIVSIRTEPVQTALEVGLIPLVFGDVAFDDVIGGTIVSTEQVLAALTPQFRPAHLTLVGVVDGVYDADPLTDPNARPIAKLRVSQLEEQSVALGGSHGIDVTGGMSSKVKNMARLLSEYPTMKIHLLSGEIKGRLQAHLLDPDLPLGTTMKV